MVNHMFHWNQIMCLSLRVRCYFVYGGYSQHSCHGSILEGIIIIFRSIKEQFHLWDYLCPVGSLDALQLVHSILNSINSKYLQVIKWVCLPVCMCFAETPAAIPGWMHSWWPLISWRQNISGLVSGVSCYHPWRNMKYLCQRELSNDNRCFGQVYLQK